LKITSPGVRQREPVHKAQIAERAIYLSRNLKTLIDSEWPTCHFAPKICFALRRKTDTCDDVAAKMTTSAYATLLIFGAVAVAWWWLLGYAACLRLASTNKFLAQKNKSRDPPSATKGYQPEGDAGEAKNSTLLPPP
jgi:hypothetical protein